MDIKNYKLNELKPYEKNPRKNDEAVQYVAESIRQFGFKVPIVIDKNNIIICGHTRYKAAKKLGLQSVPCIMADDLSEEQVKAFRLADNKVSEKAEWDFDILGEELSDILDIEMDDFGFEDMDYDYEGFCEAQHAQYQEETQQKVSNILNLEIGQYEGAGPYDIPILDPVSVEEVGDVKEWISFNYVLSDTEPEGKGVHFFIDDYQFERVWNNPEKYLDKLRQYKAIMTPDFSPYGDMPMATQIFNHYRKHWVGRYLQEHGCTIIPTIRASTNEKSLEWYLDGEPEGGVVAISSMWINTKDTLEYFEREYNKMFETLHPEKIYIYGVKAPDLPGNIERIETTAQKRFKGGQ